MHIDRGRSVYLDTSTLDGEVDEMCQSVYTVNS